MKLKICLLIGVLMAAVCPLMGQAYKLVWADEFDGTQLNSTNWTRETGGSGWGNNELEYYTDREINSSVANGILTITALKESYSGMQYTSARLKSQGKRFFKYGKIEARLKLPYGQGIWPAFWTLGESIGTVGWPKCGEIDIMELIGGGAGRDNRVYGTAHWDSGGHQSYGLNYTLPAGNFCDDFHRFAIVWDAQKIEWYVDDIKFCSFAITAEYLSEFRDNQFIILNVAVGGNWPGNPNSATVFPQTMQVDYVRVYQDTTGQQSINMVYPPDNSIFSPGENIVLKTEITPASYTKKVEFFQGQMKIGETRVAPYQIDWKNVQPGCYNLKAVVTNTLGNSYSSNLVAVKVGPNCTGTSYAGYPRVIPGKIEAEDYNLGGNSIGYYDTDVANSGGGYRPGESVDLEACSDSTGAFDVGWIAAGEWLKYNVFVTETGSYNIELRTSSNNTAGGDLTIYIDNADISGQVHLPYTGGWQVWTTTAKNNLQLAAGSHELKIYVNNAGFNFNYMQIVKSAMPYYIKLKSPAAGSSIIQGSVAEIQWESSKIDLVQIGLSTNNGVSWSFVASDYPAVFGTCRFIVPNVISDQCKIMIVDRKNSSVSSVSPAPFSIVGASEIADEQDRPADFKLYRNFPNPFNPSTTIRFGLPAGIAGTENIKLLLYNTCGELVKTVAEGSYTSGVHQLTLSGAGLASGIYQLVMLAGNRAQSIKIALMK